VRGAGFPQLADEAQVAFLEIESLRGFYFAMPPPEYNGFVSTKKVDCIQAQPTLSPFSFQDFKNQYAEETIETPFVTSPSPCSPMQLQFRSVEGHNIPWRNYGQRVR
jgi:hypothetical protein